MNDYYFWLNVALYLTSIYSIIYILLSLFLRYMRYKGETNA